MSSTDELSLQRINSAKERLKGHIRTTPLEYSPQLSNRFNSQIYLKLENWQKTGSFKTRGALNKALSLSPQQKRKGVITASAGNHGLGVAHAAKTLGIPAKVVIPENASLAKVNALENYDIELIKRGVDYDEAEAVAWEIQKHDDRTFVHAFSDLDIIAGQGTIALEILEELPDTDTIVVPIGGGGLISGIAVTAKAANPTIRIVGVQSVASPAMYNSVQAAEVVETPIDETIADGLAGRLVTELTLRLTQDHVEEIHLVSESSIKKAVKMILETEHMLVEGSAAVGLAALLENKIATAGKTVLVLTGRNIDARLVRHIL